MSKVNLTITDEKGIDYAYELEVDISMNPAEPDIGINEDYVEEAYIESGTLQISDYDNETDEDFDDIDGDNLRLPEHLHTQFYDELVEESYNVAQEEAEL